VNQQVATMLSSKFRSFPFRSFPKENMLGTDGINEILISVLPVSVHSKNTWNRREQTGTNGFSGSHAMSEKSFSGADLFGMEPSTAGTVHRPESAALAGLKCKVDIANEFCHDLNAPPHGLPETKVHTTAPTKCNPALSDKQNIKDF
jgi:hypothetical protein